MSAGGTLLNLDLAANAPLNLLAVQRFDPGVIALQASVAFTTIYVYEEPTEAGKEGIWVRGVCVEARK